MALPALNVSLTTKTDARLTLTSNMYINARPSAERLHSPGFARAEAARLVCFVNCQVSYFFRRHAAIVGQCRDRAELLETTTGISQDKAKF